jgi:hypothetical protein
MNEDMNKERTNLSTADIASRPESRAEGRGSPAAMYSDGHDAQGEHAEMALLPSDASHRYREQWSTLQGRFVDEPKASVREADGLVAEVIQQLATRFAEERKSLEEQWSAGSEVSTEDLRLALQHYRSFFQRLLAA